MTARPQWPLPSPRQLWTTAEVLLCAGSVGLTVALYGRFFHGDRYLPWLLLATALGTGAGVLAQGRLRRVVLVAAPFALLLGLGYGLYPHTAQAGLPGPRLIRAVVAGLGHGVPRMLTISIPADLGPDVLVIPAAVTAVAAFAAAALCVNLRAPLVPLLPGLLALTAGLLLTATSAPPRTALTAAWLLVALLVVLLRTNRPAMHTDPDPTARGHAVAQGFALGVPAVALVTAAALTGALTLPITDSHGRFDPRTVKTPPVALTENVSPLSYLKGQMLGKDRPLFTVTFPDAKAPVDRVQIAAMDSYDGSLWTISGRFQDIGTTVPGTRLTAGRSDTVSVTESAQSPFGPFLAEVGEPTRLTGAAAALDPQTGVLLNRTSATGPLDYTSAVQLVNPTTAQLSNAQPDPRASLTLGTPPPQQLVTLAQSLAGDDGSPIDRLRRIEAYVRSLPYDPQAPPGDSYYSLLRLVNHQPGYAEQHAALFAVLARILGLPARVAVGYLLDNSHRTAPDTYQVSTRAAFAWPEVDFVGLGWVAFDPTDTTSVVHQPPPTQATPNRPAGNQPRLTTGPSQVDPAMHATAAHPVPLWLIGLIALAALLLLSLGGVVLAKLLIRRERRSAGPPAGRVIGAWRAMRDTLHESGLPVPRSLTPLEMADRVQDRLGDDVASPVRHIAAILSATLYAPTEPDAASADLAWELADDLTRRTRAQLPWWRTVLRAIDPRPLLRLPAGLTTPRWLSWLISREGVSA